MPENEQYSLDEWKHRFARHKPEVPGPPAVACRFCGKHPGFATHRGNPANYCTCARPELKTWPDGQVREEEPYRCGAFIASSGERCMLLSDHDGEHRFATRCVSSSDKTCARCGCPAKGSGLAFSDGTICNEPSHAGSVAAELLPCPFCGWQITDDDVINENGRDGEATGDVGGIEYWRARCIECGGMCDGAEKRSEAVANWNRRASSLGEPVSQEASGLPPAQKRTFLGALDWAIGIIAQRFTHRLNGMDDLDRLREWIDSAPNPTRVATGWLDANCPSCTVGNSIAISSPLPWLCGSCRASLVVGYSIDRLSASAPSPEDKGSANG
jgi:hypothetical protein